MVAQFWWDRKGLEEGTMKISKILPVAAAFLVLAWPVATPAQTGDDAAAKNAKQARAKLDAMVQALGGHAWLDMKNQLRQGAIAAFFHSTPDAGTTEYL